MTKYELAVLERALRSWLRELRKMQKKNRELFPDDDDDEED